MIHFKRILIPDTNQRLSDAVDFAIQSHMKTVDVVGKDNSVTKEQMLDEESLWCAAQDISSLYFSASIFEVFDWLRQGKMAFSMMPLERATQTFNDMVECVVPFKRGFDAMNSQSIRDRNNSKSTKLDKLTHSKAEHIYTQRGEAKRSLSDIFSGKRKEKDMQEDY